MTDIILTEVKNSIGIITLNSPKSLNSISLDMANALLDILEKWKNDNEVKCLFLQGNQKAFCAGGDVRILHEAIKNNKTETIAKDALEFFIKEYTLDYTIHTYNKAIIAWGDGIVMGGGLGIFTGASHRIVTEKSQLAMPEITIGLYPDVGATWFLNRMPDKWGDYFGLTGARMNGGDALYLGIANYFINSDLKNTAMEKLMNQKWSDSSEKNKKYINTIFQEIASNDICSFVKERTRFAKQLTKVNSVIEFRSLLEEEALHDNWIKLGLLSFKAGSPTSAKVIYEQLKRGKNLTLKQVFCSELNLSIHFSMQPDFPEGVRALLIDKDHKPNWRPKTLEEVSDNCVEFYFTPVSNDLVSTSFFKK